MILIIIFTLIFLGYSMSGEVQVEKIADPVIHGEGPHWDPEKDVLYYVDITNQTVNKYDPKKKSVISVHIDGGPVTLVIPDKFDESRFVLARGLDIVSMSWDGQSPKASKIKVLASVDANKPENRFNDGKVDASGRLWAGTMGPENPDLLPFQGSLYSFDWSDEFKPVCRVSPVSVSNGIAWNRNDTLMYYIDSPTRVVYVFDFDIVTGYISNRRELFSLEKSNISGFPDGMAIDENDNLWVAVFRGSCVLNIGTKNGKLLRIIEFPVTQVTSCAFGGNNLEDLYVTTSRVTLTKEDIKKQPLAGALFKVTGLGVHGQPQDGGRGLGQTEAAYCNAIMSLTQYGMKFAQDPLMKLVIATNHQQNVKHITSLVNKIAQRANGLETINYMEYDSKAVERNRLKTVSAKNHHTDST